MYLLQLFSVVLSAIFMVVVKLRVREAGFYIKLTAGTPMLTEFNISPCDTI